MCSQRNRVVSSVLSSSATCLWKSPSDSLLLLMWSPRVSNVFKYLTDGRSAFSVTWQNGNAGMSLRFSHRPPKGMRLHAAADPTLSLACLRPPTRSHRHLGSKCRRFAIRISPAATPANPRSSSASGSTTRGRFNCNGFRKEHPRPESDVSAGIVVFPRGPTPTQADNHISGTVH